MLRGEVTKLVKENTAAVLKIRIFYLTYNLKLLI